ncbi:unnamed protein product [Bathycoccus prasinos]
MNGYLSLGVFYFLVFLCQLKTSHSMLLHEFTVQYVSICYFVVLNYLQELILAIFQQVLRQFALRTRLLI